MVDCKEPLKAERHLNGGVDEVGFGTDLRAYVVLLMQAKTPPAS